MQLPTMLTGPMGNFNANCDVAMSRAGTKNDGCSSGLTRLDGEKWRMVQQVWGFASSSLQGETMYVRVA